MAEFKKWMDENNDSKNIFEPGQHVFTNSKLKNIVEKIDCIEVGDHTVFEVSKYFVKHGGKVKECQGNQIIIKNKKGTFALLAEDLVV